MITQESLEFPLASRTMDSEKFVPAFEFCFEQYGVALIDDHGIDAASIELASSLFDEFCREPESYKSRFAGFGAGHRQGYRASSPSGDDKETAGQLWQVDRESTQPDGSGEAVEGLWPTHPIGFREALAKLFKGFDQASDTLLAAFARFLQIKPDWFVEPIAGNNAELQLIKLPPFSADPDTSPFGFEDNADVISMMLCVGDIDLEVQGRWDKPLVPITLRRGTMFVANGQMVHRMTNDVLSAPNYWLAPASSQPKRSSGNVVRFSLPFHANFGIQTLPECGLGTKFDKYPTTISAWDFKVQKLSQATPDPR